jgi:hypothetical protein
MSQPLRLETQEEVDALAPGTHFIWADDGEEYIKQSAEQSGPASAAHVSSEAFIADVRDLIRAQGSHRFKRSFNEEVGKAAGQGFAMLVLFGLIALGLLFLFASVHVH